MIIRTTLRHGKLVLTDQILVSEVELLKTKPRHRKEIIAGARRLSYARCLNHYRRLVNPHAYDDKNKKPNA